MASENIYQGFVIPVTGPCYTVDIHNDDSLRELQELVGGYIEAVPVPDFIPDAMNGTCYVNEDGIAQGLEPNMRATDFMVPGVGLMWGDYIKGNMVLFGYDPMTGENADVPESMIARARLIEQEAG